MNQIDPGFSNAHFYKWGWFIAVELTQSKAIRPPSMDRESRGGTAGVGKLIVGNRRIHGTNGIFTYSFTMKINHSCRVFIYQVMDASWEFTKNHQNFMRHMKRLSGDFIKVFSVVGSWTFVNFISMVCWQKWGDSQRFSGQIEKFIPRWFLVLKLLAKLWIIPMCSLPKWIFWNVNVAEVAFVAALLAIILPAVSIWGGLGFHQEMMWSLKQWCAREQGNEKKHFWTWVKHRVCFELGQFLSKTNTKIKFGCFWIVLLNLQSLRKWEGFFMQRPKIRITQPAQMKVLSHSLINQSIKQSSNQWINVHKYKASEAKCLQVHNTQSHDLPGLVAPNAVPRW